MQGFAGRGESSGKAIGKDLAPAGRAAGRKLLEDDVVATLSVRSTVPRTMEGDEQAAMVEGGELLLAVERHAVGSPVSGEGRYRPDLARADADLREDGRSPPHPRC